MALAALRDRHFLANARAQLDADHYGLDKIKKRLIEYLAVVRLKELQAERENQLEAEKAAERTAQLEAKPGVQENTEGLATDQSKALVRVKPTSVPRSLRRKTVKGPILL